jgi:hypothetical protein
MIDPEASDMANDGALPLELLEGGNLAFVDAIREVHDADALAEFASTWFKDRRPDSRWLLYEYLDRPLNAFRHEGLIKRLFKMAEAEGDDLLMARFLVLFDRSIRRARRSQDHRRHEADVATLEEALRVTSASSGGHNTLLIAGGPGGFRVYSMHAYETFASPRRTTMPRGRMIECLSWWNSKTILRHDWAVRWFPLSVGDENPETALRHLPAALEKMEPLRLFTVATRNYVRRRAWRYFRKLGKTHPERYVLAVSEALALYREEDIADGLALIDNWGLVHVLFHHSPALEARPSGWTTRPGRSLAELAPAPIFEKLWEGSPAAVVGLLTKARSTTVRRWAIRRVEADLALHRPALPIDGWLHLLGHDDPGVVALAARMVDEFEGYITFDVDRLLALAVSADPSALEPLCGLIAKLVKPGQVTLEQAARLAMLRPLPAAKLGFSWLREKVVEPDALRTVLALVEAECEPIRPEILRWLRRVLASSTEFQPAMVLEFLDSRHADARREGWDWFRADPRAGNDVSNWRKLIESPYDDVRLPLVAELENRAMVDDPEALRGLWASVLLNVHRGSRARPGVVRQLLHRLEASPGEAPVLLPLLGVALRSVRGPERRAGLVAVVRLVENRAEVAPLVRSSFPELQMM